MTRAVTVVSVLMVLVCSVAGADDSQVAEPAKDPEAPLPPDAVGVFGGQGAQVEKFVDSGRRCTVTSRKFLSIEIASDGAATWRGHHFYDIACRGSSARSIPRSCWVEGTGTVTKAKGGKLALTTTSMTSVAGPAIYDSTLTRWKCGRISVDVPTNMAPVGKGCVKLGAVDDYQLEAAAAAQCQHGDDFVDLKSTSFKVSKDTFQIPMSLVRKSSFTMRKVTLQEAAPQDAKPAKKPTLRDGCVERDGMVECEVK